MKVLNSLTLTLCKHACMCAILKSERESEQMISRARCKWEEEWHRHGMSDTTKERECDGERQRDDDDEYLLWSCTPRSESSVHRRCPNSNAATSCGWHINSSISITFAHKTTTSVYVSSNKHNFNLAICLQLMCSSSLVSARQIH